MLTIESIGLSSTTEVSGTTASFLGVIDYLFDHVCTTFDHDASQDNFDGEPARLTGFARGQVFSNGTLSLSTTEDGLWLLLTVIKSTFDTAASTGNAGLTGSLTTLPFVAEFNTVDPLTSLTAFVGMEFGLAGSTGITGTINGFFTAFAATSSAEFSASPRPFSLARGGLCLE
jgi:hypothetical protein